MKLEKLMASLAVVLILFIIVYPSVSFGTVVVELNAELRIELLEHLNVTVTEIAIHKDGFAEPEGWVVLFSGARTYDLAAIMNTTALLVRSSVSVGRYDMLRMRFVNATAVINGTASSLELESEVRTVNVAFSARIGADTILLVALGGEIVKKEDKEYLSMTVRVTVVERG